MHLCQGLLDPEQDAGLYGQMGLVSTLGNPYPAPPICMALGKSFLPQLQYPFLWSGWVGSERLEDILIGIEL